MATPPDDVTLQKLTDAVRAFAEAREWSEFHSPRNLVLALVGEVGELATELQWVTDDKVETHLIDPPNRDQFASELADVLTYLLRLADVTGIDLATAVLAKLELNEQRYPLDKARGSSAKYTAYE